MPYQRSADWWHVYLHCSGCKATKPLQGTDKDRLKSKAKREGWSFPRLAQDDRGLPRREYEFCPDCTKAGRNKREHVKYHSAP
jgi:hypothetical protein